MKTTPTPSNDIDAARKAADLKFERYQERLDNDLCFLRFRILMVALLATTAILAWSMASSENGKQVCQLVSELFK
jgi:hypothetical protein